MGGAGRVRVHYRARGLDGEMELAAAYPAAPARVVFRTDMVAANAIGLDYRRRLEVEFWQAWNRTATMASSK
jgi:hypothetical protein